MIHTTGVTWMGNTTTYTPLADWNPTNATYTVLELTAQQSYLGIQVGDVVRFYQPFFSTNTSYVIENAPPMPNWMGTSPQAPATAVSPSINESPAEMVFGCDGVFATNANDPDVVGNADLATALASIENCIGSAFNRGIATSDDFQPDNWAAFPQMLSSPVVGLDGTGALTAGTYYYAVSAVNQYGETAPGLELAATVGTGQNVTLCCGSEHRHGRTLQPRVCDVLFACDQWAWRGRHTISTWPTKE